MGKVITGVKIQVAPRNNNFPHRVSGAYLEKQNQIKKITYPIINNTSPISLYVYAANIQKNIYVTSFPDKV
jgi:hypothetical protein